MFIQKMKPFIEAVLVGKKVIVSISQIKNMKKGVGLRKLCKMLDSSQWPLET